MRAAFLDDVSASEPRQTQRRHRAGLVTIRHNPGQIVMTRYQLQDDIDDDLDEDDEDFDEDADTDEEDDEEDDEDADVETWQVSGHRLGRPG
jgi:hypothetical protein